MIRSVLAATLLITASASYGATTYRVTTTIKDRLKRMPVVERVIADGDNRRLTVEQQDEPFTHDVLLSSDGGKTVVALNTPLRTWFDAAVLPPSTKSLAPRRGSEVKDAKVTVSEEPTEPIGGLPVRKYVIRASFIALENYGGTKVNRDNSMTTLIWTTDKIDGALAFPKLQVTIGVSALDAELRQKIAAVTGFPLREVTTYSQAYEGGAPTSEIITIDVDDIRTVPSPAAAQFTKPSGYLNQAPVMGGPGAPVIR
ncbi:MAG TPA: hypothetical protein VGQ46_18300 [Thermoanaerobaculia bacterium]|jgi:hypothetical protein|nr:hypothetical protein [Thermoanaerobaculia bacterium]